MNEETKDQGSEVEQSTEGTQSETNKSEQVASESKLFKLPDGREVTADDLYKEHTEKLLPEFTRRSQELAEFRRQKTEIEARNKRSAEESLSKSTLLENVDPTVKDAIVQIVSPVIQEALTQRDRAEEQRKSNEAFDKRMSELEKKYPGKFNKIEILREMQKPENEIFDPEVLYQKLHWGEYIDGEIKAAMKGKQGDTKTESTSTEAPKKPGDSTIPSSFSEASKRAIGRI